MTRVSAGKVFALFVCFLFSSLHADCVSIDDPSQDASQAKKLGGSQQNPTNKDKSSSPAKTKDPQGKNPKAKDPKTKDPKAKDPKATEQDDSTDSKDGDANSSVREIDISCPYADYVWRDGARKCSDVRFAAFNNAKDLETQFDQRLAGIRVQAVDDRRLLISYKGAVPEHTLAALEQAIQDGAASTGSADENHVIRLYNSRNAEKVAAAIKGTFPGVDAGAAADDVIFLRASDDTKDNNLPHNFSNVDRLVARLDLPRPEVTLNVWSLQMSSKNPVALNEDSKWVQDQVHTYNDTLEKSLEAGWTKLSELWTEAQTPGAHAFREYVSKVDIKCGSLELSSCRSRSQSQLFAMKQDCAQDRYCLGFKDAFDLTTPSLTRLLLILVAADNPDSVGDSIVNAMNSADPLLSFPSFRERLRRLTASSKELGALRAAYVDFLYNYKWSVEYPNDFVPYELPTSASTLDGQLEPFMAALNRDVAKYLDNVQIQVRDHLVSKGHYDKKKELYSTGIVSVRAISGLASEVDTKTASFFNATPPPTINDVASTLKDVETNMPAAVQANMGAHAAAALMAGLTVEKPAVARIGRALTFKATPVSLITASGAELDVELEASEDGDSQVIFKDSSETKRVEDSSRVAQHKVATHVRVESMKLFELSSFSASLRRKNRSFPMLPPLVELPYIGSLVRIPLPSDPTFHRSFAVTGAVVVPTAADLAFGIPFVGDRIVVEPRHQVSPSDICLFEPVPEDSTTKKTESSGAADTKNGKKTSSTQQLSVAPKDPCESKPRTDRGKDKTGDQEKYVVHRLSKASELSFAVRPYHKRIVECLRKWEPSCDALSLNTIESEER